MGVAVHDVMLGCGGVTVRPVSEWASRLPPAVNRGNVPELPGFLQAISAYTMEETRADVQGSEEARMGAGLDPRLIDVYDGSGDVVEWYTQASLLCEYRGVPVADVLPMRLKGGAFAVWSQLSAADRRSATAVRDALYKAFAMDDFAAHTAFVARRLEPGESVDVFLASLRRYAALFGGVTDRQLAAAFVNGLPASVADTIRAGARSEQLSLDSTVSRARAVLGNDQTQAVAAATRARSDGQQRRQQPRRPPRPRRCWTCGSESHLAAACPNASGDASARAQSPRE